MSRPIWEGSAHCDRCRYASEWIEHWLSLHRPAQHVLVTAAHNGQVLYPAGERVDLTVILHAQHAGESVRGHCGASPVLGIYCDGIHSGWDTGQFEDFLCWPFDEAELGIRLSRLLPTLSAQQQEIEAFKSEHHMEALVGSSKSLMRVLRQVPQIARSQASVLLQGHTGTGKELFARAIHYVSSRQRKPFIPVNCGALPDHLFENEMFGHTRGAYTDAATNEPGLITVAEGGTLFLDEIDTLSLACQAKMLRFLQNREYRPLGGARAVTADVRLIAATNADLLTCIARQTFRPDLYHRLNVLRLAIPTLANRMEDIPLLARHFISIYAAQNSRIAMRLAPRSLEKLCEYSWPGNVRELESVIQRAVLLSAGSIIYPHDIDLGNDTPVPTVAGTLQEAKAEAVEHFEKSFLTGLLSTHNGNVSAAARAAGKDRRAFQRLLQKHGVDRRLFISEDQVH